MKKVFFLAISLIFLFSACGGGDSSSDNQLAQYITNSFEISYPLGWSARNKEQLMEEGAPEATLAVFRSQQEISGIFPTIAVVAEDIDKNFTSLKYAQANTENTSKVLQNFQTISREELEINNEKTILYIFSGRTNPDNADMQYAQIYFAKNGIGITVSALFPLNSEENYKQWLISSIKTFRFQ